MKSINVLVKSNKNNFSKNIFLFTFLWVPIVEIFLYRISTRALLEFTCWGFFFVSWDLLNRFPSLFEFLSLFSLLSDTTITARWLNEIQDEISQSARQCSMGKRFFICHERKREISDEKEKRIIAIIRQRTNWKHMLQARWWSHSHECEVLNDLIWNLQTHLQHVHLNHDLSVSQFCFIHKKNAWCVV